MRKKKNDEIGSLLILGDECALRANITKSEIKEGDNI
jgi:hypothetical protein